jgi:hypothetical protein
MAAMQSFASDDEGLPVKAHRKICEWLTERLIDPKTASDNPVIFRFLKPESVFADSPSPEPILSPNQEGNTYLQRHCFPE